MELDHLKTFQAVYRSGTLTAAAADLHLSQPAVSQHLKALEASLGRSLFVRLPRGVAPTPLAHALAAEITTPLDTLATAIESLRSGADSLKATLIIGGPADCLSVKVLPSLVSLTNAGMRLLAHSGMTKELVSRLANSELDLVVATTPTRQRGITMTHLFDETMVLVGSSTVASQTDFRALSQGDPTSLGRFPLVAFAESLPLIRRYWRTVFPNYSPSPAGIVLDDLRGLISVLCAGGGVGVVPSYLAKQELFSGALIQLINPPEPPNNRLYLATRTGNHQPHVTTVVDHLRRVAQNW